MQPWRARSTSCTRDPLCSTCRRKRRDCRTGLLVRILVDVARCRDRSVSPIAIHHINHFLWTGQRHSTRPPGEDKPGIGISHSLYATQIRNHHRTDRPIPADNTPSTAGPAGSLQSIPQPEIAAAVGSPNSLSGILARAHDREPPHLFLGNHENGAHLGRRIPAHHRHYPRAVALLIICIVLLV